jgi:serine/threonine protein kinase
MTEDSDVGDPKQIDKYEIRARLGEGGSSHVYLARHVYFPNRYYAVKLLKSRVAASQEEKARFLYEAGLLDMIKGPNILPVVDVGFFGDTPYIVTEYIQEGSLRKLLQEQPSQLLSVDRSLIILSRIGTALTTIHQHSIVHGDLKPENILLREQDHALLSDFGNVTYLGTLEEVRTPELKGTFAYMSPEQFQGKICRKSDQYALGCVAYELFTGQHPFTASDFDTWKQKHVTEPPRPLRETIPDLEANIESATLTALAKEPDHRHTDVDTFVQQLRTTTSSSRLVVSSPASERSPEVETAPPVIKDAAIDTAAPPVVQQSNAIINNVPVPAPTVSTPPSQPQDHPPSLYELQLPNSFIHLLTPALKASGLSTDNALAYRPKKSKPYTYTRLLRNKEPVRCLLHIDDEFLKIDKYIDNLIVMLEAFQPEQFLIIFLDTHFPPIQLRNLFKSERKSSLNYITKSDLEELSSLSPEEYARVLADALELEEQSLETTVSPPLDQLEPDDANDLANILVDFAQSKDDLRTWHQLFEADGLRDLARHFDFAGDRYLLAMHIIQLLISRSVIVKQKKRDALGLLLTHLLKYPDFPQDNRPKVLEIIDKYQLLLPDEYDKLKGDNR